MESKNLTKTIILKSPDSDKVREVIVTSVLLPKSENENNRITQSFVKTMNRPSCENSKICLMMENRGLKRRLDHLSLEEKILRKKLKNREAAQTSRDRKKARLEELEVSVVQLQNENDSLHEEVRSLKDEKESLVRENARLAEEVWRLSVASGASGPAEGTVSAPSTLPPTDQSTDGPACETPSTSDAASLCLNGSDWDWLDQAPITPIVEELEWLANSLFTKAHDSQEAETQEGSLVGTTTKSLESCWPCLDDIKEDLTNTGTKTSVTYLAKEEKEPTKLLKWDVGSAKLSNKQSLKSPNAPVANSSTFKNSNANSTCTRGDNLKEFEPTRPLTLDLGSAKLSSKPSVNSKNAPVEIQSSFKTSNSNSTCTRDESLKEFLILKSEVSEEKEKPIASLTKDINVIECEDSDNTDTFMVDTMDYVVKEEVVETSELNEITVPTIVLTETVDLTEQEDDDDIDFSGNLLVPTEQMEETSSDHGYESYDSPISEPDELVNLFPELWY